MTTKQQQEIIIDAPISLSCLFNDDSSSEDEDISDENQVKKEKNQRIKNPSFEQNYEIQTITLTNKSLQIRQFAFHSHNANRVWPGTFALSDYLLDNTNNLCLGNVLELGSATGIISIRLAMELQHQQQSNNKNTTNVNIKSIITSDVNDEYKEVQENIKTNFELNGFEEQNQPLHVPHTWGQGWNESIQKVSSSSLTKENMLDTIIASDILLYVSTYPLLVQTLQELFEWNRKVDDNKMKFIMSWNRRIQESKQFFDFMTNVGFSYTVHGNGLYTFVRNNEKN